VIVSQAGDLALLVGRDGKQFILALDPTKELQTHRGVLRHADLVGVPWGTRVASHTGVEYLLLQPTLRDLLLHIKRTSQIIFPKDLGYILLRLSIGPGARVVEAGTGSGALTCALAWSVGLEGHVYSYDRREDMLKLARRNLEKLGLAERVTLHQADIAEGFDETEVPSLFLDLPQPEDYLEQAHRALRNGGVLGAILPTSNQVSRFLTALEQYHFRHVEVCELLLRFYKPVAERLRPADRMVAHTGYLIFANSVLPREGGPDREPEVADDPAAPSEQAL
jgi:tRNA (adenine57-N1/adenine58-N1)-methyltransferase